ncbi:glycine cleavage system protein R [Elongatibacter sediminis]|uniref:Glycine cleavage system transcriptional repressor n=1 Tax=Elongatibacter sediminis TaxID=3119006 RepID=A0AAW9RHF3_9GAMM
MNESVVLTVVSDDRPGIVKSLSRLLEDHGGNWAESSMMSLAGKFAGILLARVPQDRTGEFLKALAALEAEGVHILAQRTGEPGPGDDVQEFSLDLVGQDRPGIVHDITDILTRHGINVQELETRCESASMSAEVLFHARARMRVPGGTSVERLREELEDLANELMVDIVLDQ